MCFVFYFFSMMIQPPTVTQILSFNGLVNTRQIAFFIAFIHFAVPDIKSFLSLLCIFSIFLMQLCTFDRASWMWTLLFSRPYGYIFGTLRWKEKFSRDHSCNFSVFHLESASSLYVQFILGQSPTCSHTLGERVMLVQKKVNRMLNNNKSFNLINYGIHNELI